jgi:glycosyltransferase involved in cell wall biosynthesis
MNRNKNNIWVVVPAYNERRSISKIIRDIKKYTKNVIIVDDGSKDGTSKIADKSNAIVLRHIVNLGKGAALKTGCDFAVKQGARLMVVIDADAQHNPKDIPKFIENLKDANIVFGYRKRDKQSN